MSTTRLPTKVFFPLLIATLSSAAATPSVTSAWQSLNNSVGGRLFTGTPWALPCFSSANVSSGVAAQNSAECAAVQTNYLDRDTRVHTFGTFQNTQWETCQTAAQQCLLDWTDPSNPAAFSPPAVCQQGGISPHYINVTSASDVIAAFNFSRQTKIPLTIKNTGHDYSGRSSGPNSLSLWMRSFNDISLNKAFVPQGCSAKNASFAATIGASLTWETVYAFADANGITLPGGADYSVGAGGGYLMGGGHGILSNVFGLAVDRVLEFEVVTPTGKHLFANACQNSDLFFALRGGGGATFGVILSYTTQALPKVTVPVVVASFPSTADNQKQFMSFLVNNTLQYMQEGWGGYYDPQSNLIFANPLLNGTAALASLQGMKTFVTQTLGGNFTIKVEPSYLTMYNDFVRPDDPPVAIPFAVGSRLIPKDNFLTAASRATLVDTLLAVAEEATPLFFLVSPILFGDKGGTSITPAWRNSPWHVTSASVWNYNTTNAERRQIYTALSQAYDPIRKLTPNSGAYVLESDVYEPDWQNSFWGPNYNTLLQIKNKYDPDHLLDCWRCVGWLGEQNPRYSCYDQL